METTSDLFNHHVDLVSVLHLKLFRCVAFDDTFAVEQKSNMSRILNLCSNRRVPVVFRNICPWVSSVGLYAWSWSTPPHCPGLRVDYLWLDLQVDGFVRSLQRVCHFTNYSRPLVRLSYPPIRFAPAKTVEIRKRPFLAESGDQAHNMGSGEQVRAGLQIGVAVSMEPTLQTQK